MTGWWKCHIFLTVCYFSLSVTTKNLYDVTTIYRFDDLEYVLDPECGTGEFLCGDGMCLKRNAVCDGTRNCKYGSDEENCRVCRDDQFQCSDGSCIADSSVCDEETDCEDGEDENNCYDDWYSDSESVRKRCLPGQFRCSNNVCISGMLRCDGNEDCSNGLDEKSCKAIHYDNMKEAFVEVHTRTNALGMTIFPSEDSITRVPDTETKISSWPSGSEMDTAWRAENWKLSSDSFLNTANFRYKLSWLHDNVYEYTDLTNPVNFVKEEQHNFLFVPISSSGFLIIRIELSSLYYIKLSPQGGTLYQCQRMDYRFGSFSSGTYNLPGLTSGYHCEENSKFSVPLENEDLGWKSGHAYKFRLSLGDLYLTAEIFNNLQWHTLVNTNIGGYEGASTYQLGTQSWKGMFMKVENSSTYFELEGIHGKLESPQFYPSFKKICVSVESSITPESQSWLKLTAEEVLGHKNFNIGVLNSQMMQEPNILGFSRHRFLVDVPEEFQNNLLQLVLSANKSGDAHVFLHKISGCNLYDKEDIMILPKRYVSKKAILPAYTVTDRHFLTPIRGTPKDCMNGGLYSESTGRCYCAGGFVGERCEKGSRKNCLHGGAYDVDADACKCPAGFVGELCEQGCGPNRFGDDCKGFCSGSITQCKNMILCRAGIGCECAPGIKGNFCDEDCAKGEYGAGCKETCGNCQTPPCNPYTGVCPSGCQPGFYPPLCKNTYRRLVSAPDVILTAFTSATVSISLGPRNLQGQGEPRFFQLQYRLQGETEWKEKEPQNMPEQKHSDSADENVLMNVTSLQSGMTYQIRVVLIDKDGSSYQKEDVNFADTKTQCIDPADVSYDLYITNIQENGFQINWNFTSKETTWCPVTHFEVHVYEASRWIIHEIKRDEPQTLVVSDKLPGRTFYVKVRGVMEDGAMSFSPKLAVTTRQSKPGEVRNIRVASADSTEIQLQWDRPWDSVEDEEKYHVQYKCSQLLACKLEDCSSSTGSFMVVGTSALLEDLLPHAQYLVEVTAVLSEPGSGVTILATTNFSEPRVEPERSSEGEVESTNTSLVVRWSAPGDCSGLNGYLHGYRYELYSSSEQLLQEGTTDVTHIQLLGLTPHTGYEVRVYLLTSAGYSEHHFLTISTTTKATVPGPVRDLVAYKRSRKMVSLRWSPPQHVYGKLESFKVTYSSSGVRGKATSKVVTPEPCIAWPDSFCHTLTGLRHDTTYFISVQAKNSEVKDDGEQSSVKVLTREGGAPGAPVGLRLVKRSYNSLTVSWELPRMLNGVLRSFVLNIEELESYNSSECCQYFPLQELPFTAEQKAYYKEFSGLNPASKYMISVTGKTTSLGPSASLSAVTRPDTTVLPQPPELDTSFQHGSAVTVTLHPAVVYTDLVRAYLLVVVPRAQKVDMPHSALTDRDLEQQLSEAVGSPFYLAAEILPSDLEDSAVIGTGRRATDGVLWRTEDPVLDSGEYSVGQVIVLEYSGTYSVAYVQSPLFAVV